MGQTVLGNVVQQIDDVSHKASRAASAMADAVEDGVSAARRAAKQSADAASELIYDTRKRVQKHPLETLALVFAAGMAAGTAIGWMVTRKQQ